MKSLFLGFSLCFLTISVFASNTEVTPFETTNNEIIKTLDPGDLGPHPLVSVEYGDVTCTVTVHVKAELGGGWTIVSAGAEADVTFESTKDNCKEAVADIMEGIKAIFK